MILRERIQADMNSEYKSFIKIFITGCLWGSIGLFQFDLVAWICGGPSSLLSRIIYTVVGLAGVWCISLIFRARDRFEEIEE